MRSRGWGEIPSHQHGYISYANLLVQGTPREVLEGSGLATWSVERRGPLRTAAELRELSGITQVVPFGNLLHVSGSDPVLLDTAIAPYRQQPRWLWTRSQAGLEDAFIHLMDSARDNYQ